MILRIVAIALLAATPAAAQSPAPASSQSGASSLQNALAALPHPAAAYLVGPEGEDWHGKVGGARVGGHAGSPLGGPEGWL